VNSAKPNIFGRFSADKNSVANSAIGGGLGVSTQNLLYLRFVSHMAMYESKRLIGKIAKGTNLA